MKSSFEQIQTKLDEYKENYTKVQTALLKNNETAHDDLAKTQRSKDLQSLLQDIEKAIAYHQDLLKFSKDQVETYFTSIRLQASDIGKKCNLYYEKDQNWYPGEISSVNVNNQTAEVLFFGFAEHHQLPASYIQILIPPKVSDLSEGKVIEALLPDGKWHYASIESISGSNIIVRIARWGHIHEVTVDAIRLVSEEGNASLLEKDKFTVPEKFKILPNDPENVRLKKKKKVKAMRKAWRTSQIEKETKVYVSSWKNFQQKNQLKKESIFKSPASHSDKGGIPKSGLEIRISESKKNGFESINKDN